MHENTWGRVTFSVNLMFIRLDKFDGPIFAGAYIRVTYIPDVSWVTYLGRYIRLGGLYTGGVLTGFYVVITLLSLMSLYIYS